MLITYLKKNVSIFKSFLHPSKQCYDARDHSEGGQPSPASRPGDRPAHRHHLWAGSAGSEWDSRDQAVRHQGQRCSQASVSLCRGHRRYLPMKWCRWAEVTISRPLLSSLLPGPVTVVFHRAAALNPDLNPGTKLVGVRVPAAWLPRGICRAVGQPMALTSANPSSQASTLAVEEFRSLWPSIDLILDGGKLTCSELNRKGSTVVDLSQPGFYKIIRDG
ncbi:YRDC, partial [Cordylochernes scorpioides]